VPVGSIEQHGPHLPLDTDLRIAEAVARRAVEDVRASGNPAVLVGPTVSLGSAGEHRGFAGSLSIGQAATADTLIELARSAIDGPNPWCERIVLVVGHGGNVEPVLRAVRTARAESRPVDCWFPADPEGDAHAGHTETSVMLAIDPSRVRPYEAVEGYSGPLAHVRERLVDDGLAAVTASGVLGDPRSANVDYGAGLLRRWVAEVVEMVGMTAGGSATARSATDSGRRNVRDTPRRP
jgi:creatinine amidohydrolase